MTLDGEKQSFFHVAAISFPHNLLPVSRLPLSILKKKEPLPVFFLSFFLYLFPCRPSGMSSRSSQPPSRHRPNLQLFPNRQTDAGAITVGSRRKNKLTFFFPFPLPFSASRMGSHPPPPPPAHPFPGMMRRFIGVDVSCQSISAEMMRKSSCIYIS